MCLNFQIGNQKQKVQPYTCKYSIFNYITFFRIFQVFTFYVANDYTLYILVDFNFNNEACHFECNWTHFQLTTQSGEKLQT